MKASQRQNTANQTRAKENPQSPKPKRKAKERVQTSSTQAQQQLVEQSKPREGNGIPSWKPPNPNHITGAKTKWPISLQLGRWKGMKKSPAESPQTILLEAKKSYPSAWEMERRKEKPVHTTSISTNSCGFSSSHTESTALPLCTIKKEK